MDDNISNLNYNEREKLLNSYSIDNEVYDFVKDKIANIYINFNDSQKSLISLMDNYNKSIFHIELCEAAILFFNNYDYVIRGYITMSFKKQFWHYWIGFSYKGELYVYDPSLNIITLWSLYRKVFEIENFMMISSNKYKETFRDMLERQKENIIIKGLKINKPYFNNKAHYEADIVDNKLKKLVCHLKI